MRVTTLAEALHSAAQHGAKTLVLDVEPVVAYWDSGQQALDQGVRQVLAQVGGAVPGVAVVCFATNSARRPSASLTCPGVRVEYLTSAGKPFRVAPYQGFPAPGVVIGDQPLTDGLLAGSATRSCTARRTWRGFLPGPGCWARPGGWCGRCWTGGPTGSPADGPGSGYDEGVPSDPALRPDAVRRARDLGLL